QLAKLLFAEDVPSESSWRLRAVADHALVEHPSDAAHAIYTGECRQVQIRDDQCAAGLQDAIYFRERSARLREVDDKAHEGCVEGAVRERRALTILRLETHVGSGDLVASHGKHPGREIGGHNALRFTRKGRGEKSCTAAQFDHPTKRTFFRQLLPHDRPR